METPVRKLTILFVVGLALSGCATQPLPTSETRSVTDRAVHNTQLATPRQGTGSVLVKRDTGLMGSACTYRIYANGRPVVDLKAKESFQFYLPAGSHIIGARPATVCGGGTSEAQVIVKENATANYRLASGQMGDIRLQPTAF